MINLQIIIDGLEMVDDMNHVFLDTEAQETVYLSEFDPSLTEDTAELMDEYPDRFIPLPSQREINEYGMMEDFIEDLPDGEQKYTLSMAINGRGAFRRFKDTIHRFGLEDSWYPFRDKCYARVARRWCEDNDVEYYQKGTGVPLEELLEDIAEDEGSDEPMNVVKIDKEALSTAGGLEGLLNSLFADSGVEFRVDDDDEDEDEDEDDDEEESFSLTPAQAVKYHDIYKRLSTLQGEIENLADEVDGSAGEALEDASSNIKDALERLDDDVNVRLVMNGKAAEDIEALADLLKKLKEEKD